MKPPFVKYFLTKEGYGKLKARLMKLKEMLKELQFSKSEIAEVGGNAWHDNPAFENLIVREQSLLSEVAQLKEKVGRAEIIETATSPNTPSVITIGSKVKLQFNNGTILKITLTDPEMADPQRNLVSYESPLGKAIIGRKVGETIEFVTPTRKELITIREIF